MNKKYKILAGYMLVEPIKSALVTTGGIHVPGTVKLQQQTAKVVAVGSDTEREKMEVGVGDTILYSKGIGMKVEIEHNEYLLIRQKDVLCFYS